MIVVDASAALAWSFEDERTDAAMKIGLYVREHGAIVPALWPLEVANILRVALIRGRISAKFRAQTMQDLGQLGFVIDDETSARAWAETSSLADSYGLTVYDAAYLELALRRNLSLATFDKALADAARSAGVAVLP